MKRVTMADVAERAGVSKSTVSQYLNQRYEYMGEETKKKIAEVIDATGYQANTLARSLKQKRTFTIGVIVANILHIFSTQVIRAIEDVCHQQDISVIVCNADDDPKKEEKYITMLRAKQVDGLIVFPTGENKTLYDQMVQERYPLVFVDRLVEGLSVDTFLLDNKAALRLAVDYLVEKQHRYIAIITTSLIRHVTPRVERISGYRIALEQHDLPIHEEYIQGVNVEDISIALAHLLALTPRPTAIIAGNDLTLMEILKSIKRDKKHIPNDFALLGIDDVAYAPLFEPPLTTIAQPAFQIGEAAARCLLEKINSESMNDRRQPGIHRFQPKLVVRASC
ncbi:LacI family transcriptional regulator [Pullulanibacillus camelliae]|uniref:LacI family transcriptional regulator n=1 Tax=Pullulanibacillus camelliae TaxID=1707096 RepID=A0A8J3DWR7_9BACL|nr:substrate-binding domain-containing protein [Pullulanibacillus camelliae]GGE44339.1 LacI family transcriptional regulator [Pullulanibacillus camelliae]